MTISESHREHSCLGPSSAFSSRYFASHPVLFFEIGFSLVRLSCGTFFARSGVLRWSLDFFTIGYLVRVLQEFMEQLPAVFRAVMTKNLTVDTPPLSGG